MNRDLVTYVVAAARCQRDPVTIRRWVSEGRLEKRGHDGRRVLVDMAEVWVCERKARAADTRRVGAGSRGRTHASSS